MKYKQAEQVASNLRVGAEGCRLGVYKSGALSNAATDFMRKSSRNILMIQYTSEDAVSLKRSLTLFLINILLLKLFTNFVKSESIFR